MLFLLQWMPEYLYKKKMKKNSAQILIDTSTERQSSWPYRSTWWCLVCEKKKKTKWKSDWTKTLCFIGFWQHRIPNEHSYMRAEFSFFVFSIQHRNSNQERFSTYNPADSAGGGTKPNAGHKQYKYLDVPDKIYNLPFYDQCRPIAVLAIFYKQTP